MSNPSQSYVRNCLLSALPKEAYDAVRPHLEATTFDKGDVLIEANAPFSHVHFMDRGIGSMIVATADSRRVEVGIFGRDGMSGIGAILGAERMSQQTVVQLGGDGYRVPVAALKQAMSLSRDLHYKLLLFVQTLMTQASFTALSNANQLVEERLARWLLMCHDRIDGDVIQLTHEFLSIMLAVQRPSVTSALHVLEGHGFIRGTRGNITIVDRGALVDFADGAYGAPEEEYRQLIGALG